MCSLPDQLQLLLPAHDLPRLRRVGWWPHMPQLPCHWPQSGPPLQPSRTSHWSGPGEYVDCTHPVSPIPSGSSAVLWPALPTCRLWLPPLLTFIPAKGLSPWGPGGSAYLSPTLSFHLISGPGVSLPLRYPTTTTIERYKCAVLALLHRRK